MATKDIVFSEAFGFESMKDVQNNVRVAWIGNELGSWAVVDDFSGFSGFHTPVTALIQWIYDLEPDHARRILRSRIYLNYEPSLRCRETVRVAAKRMSFHPEIPNYADFKKLMRLSEAEVSPACVPTTDEDPEKIQCDLDALSLPRYLRNRVVEARWISASGQTLLQAENTNAVNKTRHAEINLLLMMEQIKNSDSELFFREIQGSEIHVSLQPCRMCAAWIRDLLIPLGLKKVVFSELETGPYGRAPWYRPGLDNWMTQLV